MRPSRGLPSMAVIRPLMAAGPMARASRALKMPESILTWACSARLEAKASAGKLQSDAVRRRMGTSLLFRHFEQAVVDGHVDLDLIDGQLRHGAAADLLVHGIREH